MVLDQLRESLVGRLENYQVCTYHLGKPLPREDLSSLWELFMWYPTVAPRIARNGPYPTPLGIGLYSYPETLSDQSILSLEYSPLDLTKLQKIAEMRHDRPFSRIRLEGYERAKRDEMRRHESKWFKTLDRRTHEQNLERIEADYQRKLQGDTLMKQGFFRLHQESLDELVRRYPEPFLIQHHGFGLGRESPTRLGMTNLWVIGDGQTTEYLMDIINANPTETPQILTELFSPSATRLTGNPFYPDTNGPFSLTTDVRIFDYRKGKNS